MSTREPTDREPLTIGQCATLACVLEATARKPGNVHPGAAFEDVSYLDFLASAVAIGPAFDAATHGAAVGAIVLDAVRAMRRVSRTNTYLGTILLIAPLAAVPRDAPLDEGVARVLAALGPDDARDVYAAIRRAAAGGLGRVEEYDVNFTPPQDLVAAMRLAAKRDLVARQYTNAFADVLDRVLARLCDSIERHCPLEDAIVHAHVRLMSESPDSLIERKCGAAVAQESAERAARVLAAGPPGSDPYTREHARLDAWLRADGSRRNPGTSADLVAAGLFAALRDGIIGPTRDSWHS